MGGFWDSVWAVVVDVVSVALILWIFSGLLMWWSLPVTRAWGWLALASGTHVFRRHHLDALTFPGFIPCTAYNSLPPARVIRSMSSVDLTYSMSSGDAVAVSSTRYRNGSDSGAVVFDRLFAVRQPQQISDHGHRLVGLRDSRRHAADVAADDRMAVNRRVIQKPAILTSLPGRQAVADSERHLDHGAARRESTRAVRTRPGDRERSAESARADSRERAAR